MSNQIKIFNMAMQKETLHLKKRKLIKLYFPFRENSQRQISTRNADIDVFCTCVHRCWLKICESSSKRDAWFPAFRCRCAGAVTWLYRSQIPLLSKKSVKKFRSVRAVNGKNLPLCRNRGNRIDFYFFRCSVSAQPIIATLMSHA